jgi:hypothetical protein
MSKIISVERISTGQNIIKQATWWDRLLCKIFGHIEMNDGKEIPHYNVDINHNSFVNSTVKIYLGFEIYDKLYCCKKELYGCRRCGIYEKTVIIEHIPLTQDEQMIKDIIE